MIHVVIFASRGSSCVAFGSAILVLKGGNNILDIHFQSSDQAPPVLRTFFFFLNKNEPITRHPWGSWTFVILSSGFKQGLVWLYFRKYNCTTAVKKQKNMMIFFAAFIFHVSTADDASTQTPASKPLCKLRRISQPIQFMHVKTACSQYLFDNARDFLTFLCCWSCLCCRWCSCRDVSFVGVSQQKSGHPSFSHDRCIVPYYWGR